MRVPDVGGADAIELVMPSWTPGSYLLREFPRNVQDWSVRGPGPTARRRAGARRGGRRTSAAWRRAKRPGRRRGAAAGSGRRALPRLRERADGAHQPLDSSHASVNGASVFMYVRDREREELGLTVDAPAGWRVTTALAADGGRSRSWRADYDELVDSPLEIGTHELLEWEQEGVPHALRDLGPRRLRRGAAGGGHDADRAMRPRAAVRRSAAVRALPLHPAPASGGRRRAGAPRARTLLQADRWGSFEGEGYESFLGLIAHEFFHVWNGKRIRPAPLGPFDYTRENYTRDLWVVEGITTYYTDLILLRAGLIAPRALPGAAGGGDRATPGAARPAPCSRCEESVVRHLDQLLPPGRELAELARSRTTRRARSSRCCWTWRFAGPRRASARWTT